MKVNVQLDNGFLPDKYTKHAEASEMDHGNPMISFPFQIKDVPERTKSIAFSLIDYDSIPVCGYAWIHWSGANLPADITSVPENVSQSGKIDMVQGNNSTDIPHQVNPLKTSHRYTGPRPPFGVHNYTLTVFALDKKLELHDGYWLNEMIDQAKGHTITTAKIDLPVKA